MKLANDKGQDYVNTARDITLNTILHIAVDKGHLSLLEYCLRQKVLPPG
jgi:hypothetical protein